MDEIKILIVNYEKGYINFIEHIANYKLGLNAFVAFTAQNAFDIFVKERPEIVITDVDLPDSVYNGNELIRRIKAINKDTICLVATCNDYNKALIEESKIVGALHYFWPDYDLVEEMLTEAKEIVLKTKK